MEAPGEESGIPGSEGFRFRKERKVHKGSEIRDIFRRGSRSRGPYFDVFELRSERPRSRVGIIVPKHRRRIVDRNLLRRRLRELVRQEVLPAVGSWGLPSRDLILRARPEAYDASFAELCLEIRRWLERRAPRG